MKKFLGLTWRFLAMLAVLWLVFFVLESLDEYTDVNAPMTESIAVLPGAVGILFCCLAKKIKQKLQFQRGWTFALVSALTWILWAGLCGGGMIAMVARDIIPQKSGGWEYFLNGIEYYLMAASSVLLPLCAGLVYGLSLLAARAVERARAGKQAPEKAQIEHLFWLSAFLLLFGGVMLLLLWLSFRNL